MKHSADTKPRNKYSELLSNTGILTIGNFSSKILVFLLVPLYTSVLTTKEYGFYDLILTSIQLAIPILTLNVTDAVLRFCLESRENISQVIRITFRFLMISLIPVAVALGVNAILKLSGQVRDYSLFIFFYYAFYMLNQYLVQVSKGIDKVRVMAIAGVLGTVVTVSGCIVTLLVIKMGMPGFFLSNILGQAIPTLYIFLSVKFWRQFGTKRETDDVLQKRMLDYSIPLIMTNIGWWLNNTSDKYIISLMRGVDVNGLLSVAYKIPSILTIIYGLFIQAWQISAMKEYGKQDSARFYNTIFRYLNVFVFYVAAGLIILTKPLARVAFANDFYEAWIFVPFLIISSVFTASSGFIAPVLSSTYNTKAVARSTILGGLANIVLNICLLYAMGPQGVAVATAISSFIILYLRYRAADGMIERREFLRCAALWICLIIQAVSELYNLYIAEIAVIVLASAFTLKDMMALVGRLKTFILNRRKG